MPTPNHTPYLAATTLRNEQRKANQMATDASTIASLRKTLDLLADDARNGESSDVEVSKDSVIHLVSGLLRIGRRRIQAEPNGQHKGDEMKWEKVGPKYYKASNGSGFVAHVDDRDSHFLVTPSGQLTVEVPCDSLDALKLVVTKMSIELAVAS